MNTKWLLLMVSLLACSAANPAELLPDGAAANGADASMSDASSLATPRPDGSTCAFETANIRLFSRSSNPEACGREDGIISVTVPSPGMARLRNEDGSYDVMCTTTYQTRRCQCEVQLENARHRWTWADGSLNLQVEIDGLLCQSSGSY